VAADFISLIGIGAAAFVATNIDDIVVLMVFSSSSNNFQAQNIVIGQYLGIGSLIAISSLGSLIALVVPSYVIGLMGLLPIAMALKSSLRYGGIPAQGFSFSLTVDLIIILRLHSIIFPYSFSSLKLARFVLVIMIR
jgi:hypothetical protein